MASGSTWLQGRRIRSDGLRSDGTQGATLADALGLAPPAPALGDADALGDAEAPADGVADGAGAAGAGAAGCRNSSGTPTTGTAIRSSPARSKVSTSGTIAPTRAGAVSPVNRGARSAEYSSC